MKLLYIQSVYYYACGNMKLANQSIIKLTSEILAEADREQLCSAFIENAAQKVAALSNRWRVYDKDFVLCELSRRSGLAV